MTRRSNAYSRTARVIRAGLYLGALAVVTVPLAACGEDATLEETSWRLTSWSLSSIDPQEFTITAEFADGRVSGTAAVNTYGADYTTGADGALSLGEVMQTLMAGPEPAMRAETAFVELLRASTSYRVEGSTLTLFDDAGNETLVFEAASP